MEFPKLEGGWCDGLGCGHKDPFCFCEQWLRSREQFQKVFGIPWSEDRTPEQRA